MKKIFFVLIIAAAAFSSQKADAQYTQIVSKVLTTPGYGNTLDTVTNTATKSTNAFTVATWSHGITAGVVVTKISGTVGGTLSLQGSQDGTNWFTVGSAATPSDASANYSFNTTVAWSYYRISWTGTGTMAASFKSFIEKY